MTDMLLAHYKTVRGEVLTRMNMRQTVLVLYLGSVGTVLGLALDGHLEAGIIIPLISFGVAWIIRDHELGLTCLGMWLREEYQRYLETQDDFVRIPQWDASIMRTKYSKLLISRFIGYGALLAIADLTGLYIAWFALDTHPLLRCAGMGLFILTLATMICTYLQRHTLKV